MQEDALLTYFSEDLIKEITVPEKFTFPFFYEPHPLAKIAVKELQNYLEKQTDLDHNFGLSPNQNGLIIGKMFGVLVVEDTEGKLGYLSAFSGKLAGANIHHKFVPPVFDMLTENSFFLTEEEILNSINQQIEMLESNEAYVQLKTDFKHFSEQASRELKDFKIQLKQNKAQRKKLRESQKLILPEEEYVFFEGDLIKQSLRDKHELRVLENYWQEHLNTISAEIKTYDEQIENLKQERREKSSGLQQQLFEQYSFLNQYRESKSLGEIFRDTVFGKPPAGAGECATPKLLHFAFQNQYKPLSMAEFWWGASPKSEIRKHKHFYPACSGKCEPILKYMLGGIETDENPFLNNLGKDKLLEIIFEDNFLVVVNKPFNLLSVPGIHIKDSVYSRLKAMFMTIEPLIVHRLDMATSGLLVVAKTKDTHKHLQRQFLKQTVVKEYSALLSGVISQEEGEINLPLRGDLDNRPRQLVCFEFGKKAITKFKVIKRNENRTKVHFFPLTGRTHQLRMHAAHQLGLNTPIVGDDLYGTSDERLFLHARHLEFTHPKTGERMLFDKEEDF